MEAIDYIKRFSKTEIHNKFMDLQPDLVNDPGINRVILDVIYCRLVYGASLSDYIDYDFATKSHFERKEFVTDKKRKKLWWKFNGNQYDQIFRNKYLTYQSYRRFYSREMVSLETIERPAFQQFCANKKWIFLKPFDSCSGVGARKLELKDNDTINMLFNEYYGTQHIAEEVIDQHNELADFHPLSVNTIRVNTVVTRQDVKILGAALKLGVGGDIVDNYTSGGLITAIDIESGVVITPGRDVRLNWHVFHPDTNKQIVGFEIPHWSEVKQFALDLATVIPQARFIGWDIALAKDGNPVLVEGNIHSTFLQVADQVGKLRIYKEALRDC